MITKRIAHMHATTSILLFPDRDRSPTKIFPWLAGWSTTSLTSSQMIRRFRMNDNLAQDFTIELNYISVTDRVPDNFVVLSRIP